MEKWENDVYAAIVAVTRKLNPTNDNDPREFD